MSKGKGSRNEHEKHKPAKVKGACPETARPGDASSLARWREAERAYGKAVKRAFTDLDDAATLPKSEVINLVALRGAAARWCDVYCKEIMAGSDRVDG